MDGKKTMDTAPNTQAPTGNETVAAETTAPETKLPLGTQSSRQQREQAAATDTEKGKGTEGEKTTANPQDGQKNGAEDESKVDYKQKFSASSAEAQRLLNVLKENGIDPETGKPMAKTEETTTTKVEPERLPVRGEPGQQPSIPLTDEQLAAAIPGFANLSEEEKTIIRDTKSTVKGMAELRSVVAELYDEKQYSKDFKTLTTNPKWKQLAESAEEFKEFAYKEENLKVPLETLAASFLYEKGLSAKKTEDLPKQPSGLEPGSGGGNGARKTEGEITTEELAVIRRSDPKRYFKMAREGKIKNLAA